MPEMVRRQPIRFSFMKQMQRKFLLEYLAERIPVEDASFVAEQVVLLKVVRKRLRSLLLTSDGRDNAITLPGGNAVIAPRFRKPVINGNPPVSLTVLNQTAASALDIRHFQVGEIFKAHARAAQDQHGVPVHRLEDGWFLPRFERTSGLFEQPIELLKDIGRKWSRLRHWGNRHIF